MDTQTMDAFNRLLTTIQNVGIGALAVTIIGVMVIAFILDLRNRARQSDSDSKQFERVTVLLGDTLNNQDKESAKALLQIAEVLSMNRISLDQNTLAFQKNTQYREETLAATKQLTQLQQEANAEFRALRIDMKPWAESMQSSIGILDKKIEIGLRDVEKTIIEGVRGLPEQSGLKRYFMDVIGKLDEILQQARSNEALIRALAGPTALDMAAPDDNTPLLREAKRDMPTPNMADVTPSDVIPYTPAPKEPTGDESA